MEGREGPRHGVVLGLSWLDQEIDDYGERGRSSTSMHFSDIDRDSLVLRGGYRIEASAQSHGMAPRPFIGIAYERELNDDPISVTAGSNTMAGRFRTSGFTPPGQWGERGCRCFGGPWRASQRSCRLLGTFRRQVA